MSDFITKTLAVYYLSKMLADETGPFGACAALRKFIAAHGANWLVEGSNCQFCWSFWLALAFESKDATKALGIAGGAAMIYRFFNEALTSQPQ